MPRFRPLPGRDSLLCNMDVKNGRGQTRGSQTTELRWGNTNYASVQLEKRLTAQYSIFFLSCQNEYHETYSAVKNSELLRRGNKFIMYLSLPQALC